MHEDVPERIRKMPYVTRWQDDEIIPTHWKRWQEGTGPASWHGRCLLCDPEETGPTRLGNFEFQVLEHLEHHKCVADRGARAIDLAVKVALVIVALIAVALFIDWDGSDACPPGQEVVDVIYGDGIRNDRTVCG